MIREMDGQVGRWMDMNIYRPNVQVHIHICVTVFSFFLVVLYDKQNHPWLSVHVDDPFLGTCLPSPDGTCHPFYVPVSLVPLPSHRECGS